jgi:16S rRNA (guanine527-N7)-methyltransferase
MDIIQKYFPSLSVKQKEQFAQLLPLYTDWNSKINVISRKDIDQLYLHHVLHSLSIAKVIQFKKGTSILDAGTGGGFPGIPLAILLPEVQFHLVDSIGKKISVVKKISKALKLSNVKAEKERVENIENKYDFIISRAVTALPTFTKWVLPLISNIQKNDLQNGILYIKGGDIAKELNQIKFSNKIYPINQFFDEAYFDTKKVIHIY